MSPDDRLPWYRPSGADLVFLVAALTIFQAARGNMLDDPGLGWHLRDIDAMRAEGGWLTQDPFTYPHDIDPENGQLQSGEWRTNQWLGELPLWLGWQWAGEEGIAVVVSLVLAFMLRCLYRMLLRDGISWPWAVLWTALAAQGTAISWVARPNIFTLLFLLWTVRICDLFHQGRCSGRFIFWLVPLFAVWANVHGGFLAGLITLGATLAIEIAIAVFDKSQRREAWGRANQLGLLLAGCGLATLINPYGWSLYSWLLQLLGNDYFMNLNREWHSPPFNETGSFRFEVLMLLYPALLALSRRRPNLIELGLGVLWLHFALTGFRYVPLWVLVAIPTMAREALALPWVEAGLARIGQAGTPSWMFSPRLGPAGWAQTLLVVVLLLGLAPLTMGRFAEHNPKYIPAHALQQVLTLHEELHNQRPQARVFHAYDWGGYLTWYGWPEFQNWIDDRNEVQGRDWIEDWFSIIRAEPGWEKKLNEANVEIIAIQPDTPLELLLSDPEACPKRPTVQLPGINLNEAEWQEVYRDEFAVIFQRPPPLAEPVSN